MLGNREKATIVAHSKAAQENGSLASVEEVTADAWDAFVEAAREVSGANTAITTGSGW